MGCFQSKPEFVTVLANKQVKIGEEVILCCQANTAVLRVTWEKNGKKLKCVEGKHFMQQNRKVLILKVKNAEQGDDGEYTLKLENSKGSASCSATVTVDLNMGPVHSKPEFVTVLANKQVKIGEEVILCCQANTAALRVTWEKNGEKLKCVEGKHFMQQNKKVLILKVKNAEQGDEGKYTLKLENSKGSASCSAMVSVESSEWREMQWNQGGMTDTLQTFKINHVKMLNFLLYGPVGAGKSSIINTVKTIFEGHLCVDFLAASGTSKSHTLSYEKCVLGKDGVLPLAFHDFKGIETEDMGVLTKDVISALKGHIKEGYTFNPSTPLSEGSKYYLQNPSLSDRVHCLVNVIPADKISVMDDLFKKMKPVREEASRMGIPQVVFMTRVDAACPLTKKNLCNVYKSRKIKENMYKCHFQLGVPVNCIFPVQNYYEETDPKEDINCLMLYALTKIVHFAHDYVVKYSNKQKSLEG